MLTEIRRRLTQSYLIGLGVLLVGYSLAAFGVVQWTLLWGLDEANRHLAMPIVAALTSPDATLADAHHLLATQALASDERLVLLAADTRPLAPQGAGLVGMPLVHGVATWQGPEVFRALTIHVDAGSLGTFYVRAAHAVTRPHEALLMLAAVLAISLPILLLLAWAIADRLAAHATAPLEATLEREQLFLRDVSHELRTPLAALQGQLGLAAVAEPDEIRAKVIQLESIARRMSSLVSDMLALSREESGVAPSVGFFDFEDLVDEELALVQGLAQAQGVLIEREAMPHDMDTPGDPARLARAVRNLLENAIRYSPAGGRVQVAVERDGKEVRLRISNAGPPIPVSERERIFERFARGVHGQAARPDGTGLGLAISRAIARAHGGDVVLTSALNAPPCFTLSFPAPPHPGHG